LGELADDFLHALDPIKTAIEAALEDPVDDPLAYLLLLGVE
jgi:hypothetical protein